MFNKPDSGAKPNPAARRRLLTGGLAGVGSVLLAGCDRLNDSSWFPKLLQQGEKLSYKAQHLVAGRRALAQEFTPADLSPTFRGNGNTDPQDAPYRALAANGFADWRLRVDGLVGQPLALSLEDLRALPARTQITRHDCVEGWSAIGQWTGVQLSRVLERAQVRPEARFVVFHCADSFGEDGGTRVPYYESIDMDDAMHVQTLLAYALNGAPLPVTNGAPLRLRVERQLGYKQAKYLMRLQLVDSLAGFGDGNGGYWEDRGYQWYAGI